MTANESELDHGEETAGELLKARGQATMLLKPSDQTLDDVTPSVGFSAKSGRPTAPAAMALRFTPFGNDAFDAARAQVPPQAPSIIAAVGDEQLGSAARTSGACGRSNSDSLK